LIGKAYLRWIRGSLSTLAAAFYSSGGGSFMIAATMRASIRGDVAAAAGKIFVKVPAPRLQRALVGGPFVDGCAFWPFIGCTDRTGRAFAARPAELPLCSSLITRGNSQGARSIRAQSRGRVDGRRRRSRCCRRFGDQARNRCWIAALFACLLAARGGEIYVVWISFESSGISR